MLWCLQSALTFHRANQSRDLRGVTWGEGDLSRPDVTRSTPPIGEPLMGALRGKISTRSEMERSAPTRQVRRRVTPKQPGRCSHLLIARKRTQLTLSLAAHPILHENKEKRGAFPGAKTRHGVVTCEASPRLVQELGGRFSLCVRSVALPVYRGKHPVRQCC